MPRDAKRKTVLFSGSLQPVLKFLVIPSICYCTVEYLHYSQEQKFQYLLRK